MKRIRIIIATAIAIILVAVIFFVRAYTINTIEQGVVSMNETNAIFSAAPTTKETTPKPLATKTPTPSPSNIPANDWNLERKDPVATSSYRDAMRWWVIDIANKARETDDDFIVIPQNCTELFPDFGNTDMSLENYFLNTISGIGNESLVYGINGYDIKNNEEKIAKKSQALMPALFLDKPVLSIDYCKKNSAVKRSIEFNSNQGFLSYQAPQIELTSISKTIINENSNDIFTLYDAQNFLILLNPGKFRTRKEYISALSATNYDVIIIDCYFDNIKPLTYDEVNTLKTKANGGKRLVISYLSIGEAEDYRPYWQDSYFQNPPQWILKENPNWQGNYPVYYWNQEWQNIIAFGENSYLSIIQNAGFDGVYLDIVDGYLNFEE